MDPKLVHTLSHTHTHTQIGETERERERARKMSARSKDRNKISRNVSPVYLLRFVHKLLPH